MSPFTMSLATVVPLSPKVPVPGARAHVEPAPTPATPSCDYRAGKKIVPAWLNTALQVSLWSVNRACTPSSSP